MKHSDWSNEPLNRLVKACAVTAALAQIAPSSPGQEASSATASSLEKPSTLERILNPGPFRIRPYGWASVAYDSNFLLSPHDELDDVIWTLTPGVFIGVGQYQDREGTYASLDYSANVFLFTDHSNYDGHNQNVSFNTQWKGAKLTLSLSQGYQGSFGGLVGATNRTDREFAGTTVDQQTFPTLVQALYQISEKTSVEVEGAQVIREFDEELNSYNEWTLRPWFNYQATEKLQTSLGATFGWRDIRTAEGQTNSPNQTFEQVLGRVNYQLAAKVSALAAAGVEWDQYQGGADEGPFLVFSAGLRYQPQERTVLSLEAHRRQYPSIVYSDQNYLITGLIGSVRQHIWNKLSASLSAGYDHTEYQSRERATTTDREDDYYYIQPTVDYSITARWEAGVYYVFRQNSSNSSEFDYTDHQVGLRTAYRF